MPYLTNLAVIARRTGFPVVEEWGWKTRGHGPMSAVRSVICHHDAANQGPSTFNTVVRDGRAGLPGPLAQFTIRRDGTIHVVAAGLSYHAGSNINPSLYNNSYALGIEAGNNGVGEPWPRRQLDAYEALCAELCKAFRLPVSRVRGHKEIAPSRKIDPAGINMDHFRAAVARRTTGGGGAAPTAPEDDMPYSPQDIQLFAYRGTVTAWQDAAYHAESHAAKAVRAAIAPVLAPVQGEVAGLAEAVRQLANGQPIDLDAVREAARQGAQEGTAAGLAEGLADGAIEGSLDIRLQDGDA